MAPTRTSLFLLTVLACCLFLSSVQAPVLANERMAGSAPKANTPRQSETNKTKNSPPQDINYAVLESYGTLTNIRKGGLGIDLWQNSQRALLLELLPILPDDTKYKTLQKLQKRLLLTEADAQLMIRKDSPEAPGQDSLTLRLEKLLSMGAFDDAVKLYTRNPDPPYHERLARNGVLAMFYSGQDSLACLEVKALEEYHQKGVSFWQQAPKICTYILSKVAQQDGPATKTGQKTIKFPDSTILEKIINKPTFRFTPHTPDELNKLSPLEKALLFTDGRIDYSQLKSINTEELPPAIATLLITDKNLPDKHRFKLITASVGKGNRSPQSLTEFYNSLDIPPATKTGWQQIPALYQKAKKASEDAERLAFLKEALDLSAENPPAALLPFADLLRKEKAGDFSESHAKIALRLMLQANLSVPQGWAKYKTLESMLESSGEKGINKQDILTWLAHDISENFPTSFPSKEFDFNGLTDVLNNSELQITKIIYEKLDKRDKLHNYVPSKVYEKHVDLTLDDSYVMPSIDLVDSLKKARLEERLAEVVILSSIALHDVPPGNLYAGLLREILDGLITVGLTEEAQELAEEVVLGLN